MSFPTPELSGGGVGNNILQYIGIQGSNLSLQTLVSLNFTEVYICIRVLCFRPISTDQEQRGKIS